MLRGCNRKGSKGIEQAGGNGKRESSAKLRASAATHSSIRTTPTGFIHVHLQGTRAPQTCVFSGILAAVESC